MFGDQYLSSIKLKALVLVNKLTGIRVSSVTIDTRVSGELGNDTVTESSLIRMDLDTMVRFYGLLAFWICHAI